jgi:hypothetical protein
MQRYTVCLYLETALHVSGGISTHHQERKPTRCNVTQFILYGNCSTCFGWYFYPSSGGQTNKMQRYTVYFVWKLLYMFRVVFPPIIKSAYNGIYSIWYLSHHYCYPPLSWKSWSCSSNSSTIAAGSRYCCKYSFVCASDDGWKYHPKHVQQFPCMNKRCNVVSCWIYIGIYLRCTDS